MAYFRVPLPSERDSISIIDDQGNKIAGVLDEESGGIISPNAGADAELIVTLKNTFQDLINDEEFVKDLDRHLKSLKED